MFDKQEKLKRTVEYIHVKTTESFRMAVKIIKWILLLISIILGLYILSLFFGIYFFLSFFLGGMIILPILNKIIEIKGEYILEGRLGVEGDENNKGDIIGLTKAPHKIIELCEHVGGNISRVKTISGKSLIICEEFNPNKLLIKKAWFDKIASIYFFMDKNAFVKMRDYLISFMDDVLRTKRTRAVYHKMEFIKMFEDQEYRKDIRELEEEIKGFKNVDK
ncbi:MAG: hypothetical protein E3J52_10385 [Promethearchaeota archaeon]|nr:MAG: hypothetical protein E3J52_10385 [Candidatus Lokiarchaeota archaeon]